MLRSARMRQIRWLLLWEWLGLLYLWSGKASLRSHLGFEQAAASQVELGTSIAGKANSECRMPGQEWAWCVCSGRKDARMARAMSWGDLTRGPDRTDHRRPSQSSVKDRFAPKQRTDATEMEADVFQKHLLVFLEWSGRWWKNSRLRWRERETGAPPLPLHCPLSIRDST